MTVLDAWLPYEEEQVCHVSYASMKEGIFALKGLEGAKWKWNKQLCIPLLMPPNASDLVFAADGGVITTTPSRMFVIPLQASDFSVSGECFIGPQQIKWIGQLGKIPFKFVLHIDGKYKLHHGKWILITIGVHVLRWDALLMGTRVIKACNTHQPTHRTCVHA